jgi:hypothetical protein
MIAKTFELRDRATFVPVLAVKLDPGNDADRYLLARAGFAPGETYVVMCGMSGGTDKATSDPYDWGDNRTRHFGHQQIIEHFDALESGAVIDVEFILGETQKPKESESVS